MIFNLLYVQSYSNGFATKINPFSILIDYAQIKVLYAFHCDWIVNNVCWNFNDFIAGRFDW